MVVTVRTVFVCLVGLFHVRDVLAECLFAFFANHGHDGGFLEAVVGDFGVAFCAVEPSPKGGSTKVLSLSLLGGGGVTCSTALVCLLGHSRCVYFMSYA
jgi:hypothetical protein